MKSLRSHSLRVCACGLGGHNRVLSHVYAQCLRCPARVGGGHGSGGWGAFRQIEQGASQKNLFSEPLAVVSLNSGDNRALQQSALVSSRPGSSDQERGHRRRTICSPRSGWI